MDKSLYIAMTGAQQNMLAMGINANNLANVTTTGFRADFQQARAMPVFGETQPSRVYAMTERPGTDLKSGAMQETGRNLDIAVKGEGFIAVQAPDGSEAYTRAGDLQIDINGMLRTGNGLPVLGNGAPISLPPAETLTIGIDGTVSIRELGAEAQAVAAVDRIKLVRPEQGNLYKGDDGLLRTRDGVPAVADAGVQVQSGMLEGSNVNSVEVLTDIIELSRQFEMHVKMMSNIEENSQATARLLQFS